jgi:hypothetical protein
VKGVSIQLGIDSDSGNAHFPTGPDYPDRNLASIGDQNFL